ncbi:MAG: recombinase family protein, partial [Candidatus Melainabacteria bacterium]|nr:recombinase family protein [Candidatus Melainabacteria bacterium]
NNYELVQVFRDNGISGSLENRPALVELFNFLEVNKEVEGVLIFKLDRLARDLRIQEILTYKLDQLGKKLISVMEKDLASGDPMRKAFRQFMGIISELEKAFITMRLSGGRINKARKGGYAGGGIALGYKTKDKELFKDEKWTQVIEWIFQSRLELKLGLREIARKLNESEVPTARGGIWHAGTVRYILNNPIYKGQLVYKTETATREDLVLIKL